MRLLRPIALLFFIVVIAFIFKDNLPAVRNYFQHFTSNLTLSNIGSTTKAVEEKIQANLPPPLRGGDDSANVNSSLSKSGIITLTNTERKTNGNLSSLIENSKLDAEAIAKVDDMFAKQYFEHLSPDGRGPADLAETAGYQYILIGENLALGNFKDNQAILDAWMNSPGHRANILNTRFSQMGAAAKEGIYQGQKTWLAVQEFGAPLSSCPFPDQTLKTTIENLKADLDTKENALEAKKTDIDNTYPKSGDSYNGKVTEYNSMIAVYSTEMNEIKNNVNTYNAEVKAFNSCAGV